MSKIIGYNVGTTYKVVTNTTAGTASTSASITKLITLTIPANTFVANDILFLEGLMTKSNTTANAWSHYFYYNTSDTLTGATLIATQTGLNTGYQYNILTRRMYILTANGTGSGTEMLTAGTSYGDDLGYFNLTTAASNIAIDWTATVYLILAGTIGANTSSVTGRWMKASTAL